MMAYRRYHNVPLLQEVPLYMPSGQNRMALAGTILITVRSTLMVFMVQ